MALSLEQNQFTIQLMHRANSESDYSFIMLTYYDGKESSPFGTYDENFQEQENAQFSLSFSIAKYYSEQTNPFINFIHNGRKLRLTTSLGGGKGHRIVDFIITSITPTPTNKNVIYSIQCQDVFSYEMSKQSISTSFSTVDIGPQQINVLAGKWLEETRMNERWSLDPNLETLWIPSFPASGIDSNVRMTSSIEISDATPYTGLVNIGDLFNGVLSVTYNSNGVGGEITYLNKMSTSFTGYSLRPDVNLTAFSMSKNIDSLATILHVVGGEDAYGVPISIVPTIPDTLADALGEGYVYEVGSTEEAQDILDYIPEDRIFYKIVGSGTLYCSYYNEELELITVEESEIPSIIWSLKNYEDLIAEAEDTDVLDFYTFLNEKNPACAPLFYRFDLLKENLIMSNETYNFLNEYFGYEMRNIYMMVQLVTTQYYQIIGKLQNLMQTEEDYVAAYAALNEQEMWSAYSVNKISSLIEAFASEDDYEVDTDTEKEEAIRQTIIKEKELILQQIVEEVWNSEDNYFKLIFSTYGSLYFEEKMEEFKAKIMEHKTSIVSSRESILEMIEEYEEDILSDGKETFYVNYVYDYDDSITLIDEANPVKYSIITDNVEAHYYYYSLEYDDDTSNSKVVDFEKYLHTEGRESLALTLVEYEDTAMNALYNINYYSTYHDLYNELISEDQIYYDMDLKNEKVLNYEKRLSYFQSLLDKEWRFLYKEYGEFMIEARYEDSEQLSVDGLFNAAVEEFATYQTETTDYSATMIELSQLLEADVTKIKVNDSIYFYNKEISSTTTNQLIIYLNKDVIVRGKPSFVCGGVELKYSKIAILEDSNYKKVLLTFDDINNVYTALSDFREKYFIYKNERNTIVKCEAVLKEKKVELKINEISKALRGSEVQLSVSENKTMKNLIDRLLVSIQTR